MGERCNRTAEVRGSIPLSSTSPTAVYCHFLKGRIFAYAKSTQKLGLIQVGGGEGIASRARAFFWLDARDSWLPFRLLVIEF
jgi:hypothetical protein